MDNFLDLQGAFKFNISINFPKNQIYFKPDGFLIINDFKIRIIRKFAMYCSKKISNIYTNEKMKNNYDDDEKFMKITIKKDNQSFNWLLTKENLYILQSFLCMKTISFTKDNIEFLKFISNELEISLLSDALSIYEKFIEDKFVLNSKPVKILKDDDDFQNLLEKYSNEKDIIINQNQIQQIIDSHLDQHYLCQSIALQCISNPMEMEKFIVIIKEMKLIKEFSNYLQLILDSSPIFQSELKYFLDLNESQIVIDHENQSFINSILHLIRNDDINEFQKSTSSVATFDLNSNITINQSINENRITLFSNINSFFEISHSNQWKYNLLDFAAFYGSIKIFKYLLLMKVEMNHFIALLAVAGGNAEIIHICEQNKCDFRNALKFAIIYNHIELVDWLVETINVDDFESFIDDMIQFHQNELILKYINLKKHDKVIQRLIIKSIINDNYELFLFLNDVEKIDLKYKFDKNKSNVFSLLTNYNNPKFYEYLFSIADLNFIAEDRDVYGQTCAHIAAMKGNIKLLNFLVEKKINIEQHAYDDLTPLHIACMFGQYEIVKYILSLPNINVNCLDRFKQTPLVKACVTNNPNTLKIIDLFLNNIFVKYNYIDINNKTILLNTIQNGIDDAAIRLINCNKSIDINKSDMFYNPLALACKLNKIEVVRCLVNHKDLKINEQVYNGIKYFFFNYTALHFAVSSSIEIVNLLLNHPKVDYNICNKDIFKKYHSSCFELTFLIFFFLY